MLLFSGRRFSENRNEFFSYQLVVFCRRVVLPLGDDLWWSIITKTLHSIWISNIRLHIKRQHLYWRFSILLFDHLYVNLNYDQQLIRWETNDARRKFSSMKSLTTNVCRRKAKEKKKIFLQNVFFSLLPWIEKKRKTIQHVNTFQRSTKNWKRNSFAHIKRLRIDLDLSRNQSIDNERREMQENSPISSIGRHHQWFIEWIFKWFWKKTSFRFFSEIRETCAEFESSDRWGFWWSSEIFS